MHHRRQKQIPHPAKLQAEAETKAEELHDVDEVQRNPKLHVQLNGENSSEEFQSKVEP